MGRSPTPECEVLDVILRSFPLWMMLLLAIGTSSEGPLVTAANAAARKLSDGSAIDSWTLPNGLRVVTRDVPHAAGIAVTVAYGFGLDQDPAGREGFSQLIAFGEFLGAAGDF